MNTQYRQVHNYLESNKENISYMENRGGAGQNFNTPSKSRQGLEVLLENGLQTPFGHRFMTECKDPGQEITPGRFDTQSKVPNGLTEYSDNSPQVVLLRFEELPSLNPSYTPMMILSNIKESFHGKSHQNAFRKFESISALRSLNKFHPDDIREIFNQFGEEIIQSFSSEFVVIQKNILLFVFEALSTPRTVSIDESIVAKLIPLLLERAVSKHKEVRNLAKMSLEHIIKCLSCNESLMSFCAHSIKNTKKKQYSELSFHGLAISIKELGPNICKIQDQVLRGIFVTLSKTIMHTVPGIINLAKELTNHLAGLMGLDNVVRLLEGLIEDNHISKFEAVKIVEEITKQGETKFRQRSIEFRQMVQVTKSQPTPAKELSIDIKVDKKTEVNLIQSNGEHNRPQQFGGEMNFQYHQNGGFMQMH